MATLAVFAAGFVVGVSRGVSTFLLVGFFVCLATLIGDAGDWFFVSPVKIGAALMAGFLLAVIVSCLAAMFEQQIPRWLRRSEGLARNRGLLHGPSRPR